VRCSVTTHYAVHQQNTPGNLPNPLLPSAFQVGDYVTFAGTYATDGTTQFVAAYEIINNIAIYTQPGIDPAYTVFETAIIGTGGLNAIGVG
jgi:hypothetical protein